MPQIIVTIKMKGLLVCCNFLTLDSVHTRYCIILLLQDGPPVAQIISILGKQESEIRLEAALSYLKTPTIAEVVES